MVLEASLGYTASCSVVVMDEVADLNERVDVECENYAVVILFFPQFLLFIARPPVLSTTLKGIIMHSRLLRQHVARAYGQDTLYWL